jgi:transposase
MRTDNHTMKTSKLHLGLDVHKDSITIAIAQDGPQGEIRLFGTITNDLHALEKALSRIRKAHQGAPVAVTYKAGPCGFGIARRLQQLADEPAPTSPLDLDHPPLGPVRKKLGSIPTSI